MITIHSILVEDEALGNASELIGPLQQKKKKDQFLVHWGGGIVTTPSITLSLSNFRAKTQLKISLK